MPVTIQDMEKRHPGVKFNYAPNPDCRYCGGSGEAGTSFCICTFITPELSNDPLVEQAMILTRAAIEICKPLSLSEGPWDNKF